ncbi:hypothetical protein M422DRAFT_56860 [Sphaerobolus stellatus SS14]|uniref:Uncharacterized protein n=1 Tax=Sphaerobolus stellatus (strain SS14) TaxID=990650 RepID=A0A0C9UDY3_SPHS4|nr:hypothetical protein M422DRAFT_56860 [Sphaerobolus stellatus SS14]
MHERKPALKSASRPQPATNTLDKGIIHIHNPPFKISSLTIMDALMKAVWKRAMQNEELVDSSPSNLGIAFDAAMCLMRDEGVDRSVHLLKDKEVHIQDSVEQATLIERGVP